MSVSVGEAIGAALVAGAGAEATGITDFTPIGRSGDDNKDDPGSPASGIQTALAALSGRDAGSSVSEALIGQLADSARSGGTRIIERQVGDLSPDPIGQGVAPWLDANVPTDPNDPTDPQQPQADPQQPQTDNSNQPDGNGLWANAVRNVGYGIGMTPIALGKGAIDAGVDAGEDTREWLAKNDPTTDSDDTGLLSSARRNIDRVAGSVGIQSSNYPDSSSNSTAPMPGGSGGDPDTSDSGGSSYGSTNPYSSNSGGNDSGGNDSGGSSYGSTNPYSSNSGGNDSGGNDSGGSSYGSTNPYSSNSGGNDSGGNDSGGGIGGAVSDAADSVSDAVGGIF